MTILRIGKRYINLANVTEIIESEFEPGKVFVQFNYPVGGGEEGTDTAASMFQGKEARALLLWLDTHSVNVEGSW